MKQTIFLNGKFIRTEEAKVSVLSHGFLHGFGVFETMRAYNKKISGIDSHLRRIKSGAVFIGIKLPYSTDGLKRIIYRTLCLSGYADNYIKLTVWKDIKEAGILVVTKKYQPYSAQIYRKGFKIGISLLRQGEANLFSRLKTTNRLLYELSFQEAKQKGFDEALILNGKGYITEASRSNIFFAKGNELFTPSLDCGCLEGVTRGAILDLAKKHKISVGEGSFTISDLSAADEAFLTNSLVGVMPVGFLENKLIGDYERRKLTNFFIRKYHLLAKKP